MIQKEKYNVKRVLALILSLACVIGMLAGCGRQNTSEGKADGSSLEEQTSDTWYEIDQEAGILTVRLPAEKEGFIWNFTIDDTTLLELLTQEDNDGTFVATSGRWETARQLCLSPMPGMMRWRKSGR